MLTLTVSRRLLGASLSALVVPNPVTVAKDPAFGRLVPGGGKQGVKLQKADNLSGLPCYTCIALPIQDARLSVSYLRTTNEVHGPESLYTLLLQISDICMGNLP